MIKHPALLKEMAIAIADILNGGSYSRDFEARRGYNPRKVLSALETLTVVCVPAAIASDTFLDRGHRRKTPAIYVGVLERLSEGQGGGLEGDGGSLEQLDGLSTLVEEIMDTFLPQPGDTESPSWRLSSGRVMTADSVLADPAYDLDDLRDKRQFTSVLTVTFTVDQQ